MKKLLTFLLVLGLVTPSWAAWDKTKPADNEKLVDTPALIRANWQAIETGTDANLQITNAKVAAAAGIVDTKLATISTSGKVSGTAITGLASLPAGAGAIPIANGGTGQTTATAAATALLPTQTGNSGKSLVTNGTVQSWGYPAGLSIASETQGDVLFYNGTVWTRLGAGTSGQFLKTQGAGANPTWDTLVSVPSGTVAPYAGSTAPTGWLLCDGSAVSRTTYSALFAVIGTTYGIGDNSTTFNLPNLKGKIPVGYNSIETEFDTLGETGGEKTHALTEAELASHTHGQLSDGGATMYKTGNSGENLKGPASSGATINTVPSVTGATGSGTAHNNLQPYITLNYIIKT